MTYSRRAFLTATGTAIAGGSILEASAPGRADPLWNPRSGTTPLAATGEPVKLATLGPASAGTVMQQVERTPAGTFFMNQARSGSTAGFDTTVITRCASTPGSDGVHHQLDSMTVIDGGHGLGLHIERRFGRDYVWASLQGASDRGPTSGGRLACFRYSPGSFAIDAIPGGMWFAPQFRNAYGEFQESVYNFDWARGWAVERMFDFHTGHQERYTRRRITDILLGRDRPVGRMTIPVNPPTLQGFTTVNGTFFRWNGLGNAASGSVVTTDPPVLEQYDWRTGALIGTKTYPTIGQDGTGAWRDGAYEPEGCSVLRAPDGTASLLLGVTTGAAGDHAWPVYELARIGAP